MSTEAFYGVAESDLRAAGCLMGKTVRVSFDGRGLGTVVDYEDGMCGVRYLPDPDRTSEHVAVGEESWYAHDELVEVVA